MKPPICPTCNEPAVLRTGEQVYPNKPELAKLNIWECILCDNRVGAHENSGEPYGTMAGAELRYARQQAHGAFDGLWKSGLMSRESAYKWLSNKMNTTRDECHIGQFNLEQCRAVIVYCEGLT